MLFSNLTTRKIQAHLRNFIFIFKLLLVCTSVVLAYFGFPKILYLKFASDMKKSGFYLNNVVIHGISNLPKQDVCHFIDYSEDTFIFDVDPVAIARKVKDNPWVESCIIRRQLPNSLYIKIFERSPIAIWQHGHRYYLIDQDGCCIGGKQLVGCEKFTKLVHVVGKGANLYAHQLIVQINEDPLLSAKVCTAVRYGERRWNIFLDEIVVQMPERNFSRAWKYLGEMHKNCKLFGCGIKSIDLRNESKFYIEYY